jgi:hypothetical protein
MKMIKKLRVHFSMLADPFKQTRVGWRHQAMVSHYQIERKVNIKQNE